MGRVLCSAALVVALMTGALAVFGDDWGRDPGHPPVADPRVASVAASVVSDSTTTDSPTRAAPAARALNTIAFPVMPEPQYIPATPQNYDRGRDGAPVQFIVIHYTAISYERTLATFENPKSHLSAHYVVRGDGHVVQMVFETDTAWQAGNYWYNQRSIGIEIELDPVSNPTYTRAQYNTVAGLVCQIAGRQGMPLDRSHVVGHNEIPGTAKIDPGPTWDWPHFMWLTSLCAPPSSLKASFVSQTADPEIAQDSEGDISIVLRNDGPTAWRKGTTSEARLGVTDASDALKQATQNWPQPDRPAVQVEDVVPPGGKATFTIPVTANSPGTFLLRLQPVVDGVSWMPDVGIHAHVKVDDKVKPVRGTGTIDGTE